MAEYIDREKLPPKKERGFFLDDDFNAGWNACLNKVNSIPAADVVEVVRCKDCIYSPSGDDNGENRGFSLEWSHDDWPEENPCPCKCDDGWYSIKPDPEFYCAYGKRD